MRMWRVAMAAAVAAAGFWCWSPPASAAQVCVVRAGDTVYRIARRFAVSPAALAALNHLGAAAIIRPGQRLVVPDTAGSPGPELIAARPVHPRSGVAPIGLLDRTPLRVPARLIRAAVARTALTTRSSIFRGAAVRAALALIGRPYLWSGMGRGGFDCSGLVAHVFGTLGLLLPHSSYGQYAAGTAVLRAELFAGDLVFFQTDGPGPSHVGIYVGDNRFVHASSSRGVALDSMEDAYFSPRFIGARRF